MTGNDFGLYRLGPRIGQGANGTVFSGEYGALRRPVAVKVLHQHLVGDSSAERMLREARTISLLEHPGIVKVFDVGVANDGRAFVVMECLVGEALSARMARGRLNEARVVTFARQLASALEVAHAAGVIHRDLKPENVFIVADPDIPGGERVKIFDFGIAKCKGQVHTATGIVLGTPAYMAPEQYRGSRDVDGRADIYSLGVILYVMATGEQPFAGQDTDELVAEHAYCRPAPPTHVSPGLGAIIERCLAKQPEDRFATMAKLITALGELAVPSARPNLDDTVLESVPTLLWEDLEETTRTPLPQMARLLSAARITRVDRPAPRPPLPTAIVAPLPPPMLAPRPAPPLIGATPVMGNVRPTLAIASPLPAPAPTGLVFPRRRPQFLSEAATLVRPPIFEQRAPRPTWPSLRAAVAALLVIASLSYLMMKVLAPSAASAKARFDVAPPMQLAPSAGN